MLVTHQLLNLAEMRRAEEEVENFCHGQLSAAAGPGRRPICCALSFLTRTLDSCRVDEADNSNGTRNLAVHKTCLPIDAVCTRANLVYQWAAEWQARSGEKARVVFSSQCIEPLRRNLAAPFIIVSEEMWDEFVFKCVDNRCVLKRVYYDGNRLVTPGLSRWSWSFDECLFHARVDPRPPSFFLSIVRSDAEIAPWQLQIEHAQATLIRFFSRQKRDFATYWLDSGFVPRHFFFPGQITWIRFDYLDQLMPALAARILSSVCSRCYGELATPMISRCCQTITCLKCAVADACIKHPCATCLTPWFEMSSWAVRGRQIPIDRNGYGVAHLTHLLHVGELARPSMFHYRLRGDANERRQQWYLFCASKRAILVVDPFVDDLSGMNLAYCDALYVTGKWKDKYVRLATKPGRQRPLTVFCELNSTAEMNTDLSIPD